MQRVYFNACGRWQYGLCLAAMVSRSGCKNCAASLQNSQLLNPFLYRVQKLCHFCHLAGSLKL